MNFSGFGELHSVRRRKGNAFKIIFNFYMIFEPGYMGFRDSLDFAFQIESEIDN